MPRHRVLIVEDEHDIAGLIKHTLERAGEAEASIVGTRRRCAEGGRRAAARPDDSRPQPSGVERTRSVPHPARPSRGTEPADHHADGADHGERPRQRPRSRCGRLRHQAVQPAGTDRARPRRAAPQLPRRRQPADQLPGRSADGRFRRGRRGRRRRSGAAHAARVRAAPLPRQNKNRVVSRDRLLERVWGYDRQVETRSVDVHVGRLRSKLGSAGRQIETVVGLGYRFID